MKKFKKIFLIFICFLLIFSIIQIPTSAIAVEIVGGSYVAYAILAAALAAAGYTIATNQINPEIFQGILDSPNAELIKALIGGTSILATAKGQVFFNWTASQWATFIDWVNNYVATGELSVIVASGNTFVTDFVLSQISSYYETFIPSATGIIGYQLGSNTVVTLKRASGYCYFQLALDNAICNSSNQSYPSSSSAYYFGSPVYVNSQGIPCLTIGWGLNAQNQVTNIRQDVVSVGNWITNSLVNWYAFGRDINISYWGARQQILATLSNGHYFAITNTANFPVIYTSVADYISDCIDSGTLIGDWTGIGEDVINPSYPETEVGIDAYPDWRVGTGIDALPDELDTGTSIDIPLNPYIDTDLGPDVIDPYVDFTPWDTTTVPPDDVIPDTRINPPADVTADPDTPWADDQTYPIEYPTDTDTPLLPDDPNPNTPPSGDDSNKMKLLPLILSKFPFCLPWDLQHGFKSLVVSGSPPVFDIPLRSVSAGINENIHIDLSRFQSVATVSRWFFSALWIVLLILITRKIVWK